MENNKLTILYERLSVEDDKDTESNSITNQRSLLEEYAERNGFIPYIHVSDDGYSGTNWNRPGWLELMDKIESGEVGALLVKDSSRLGRDHLRVGLFRELLMEKGIRLISVNDGFDSARDDDDFTPFRDLMSEWYARDCSRKVKSAFHTKGKKGIPISGKPPYGYKKDPGDKTKWVVDDYAADVVRRIYRLRIDGKSSLQICKILHGDKIEVPSCYLTKNGHVSYSVGLDARDPCAWNSKTVERILGKEEYLGHVVNFRSSKKSFKSKKQTFHDKEDWLIFENVHEPIVTREEWDLVQELNKTRRRLTKGGNVSPFTGLMFCADCGAKMYYSEGKDPAKASSCRYECSSYNLSHIRFDDKCTTHFISIKTVREIVLDVIQKTAGYVQQHEDEFVKTIRDNSSCMEGESLKACSKKIINNDRRIDELEKLFNSMYEDKVRGIITEERFLSMSGGYDREQAMLRDENRILQMEIDAHGEDNLKADRFIALVRKYTRFEELTTPMINEFIERVVVHESVWSEQTETQRRKGTRSQRVDVFLKYIGSFDLPDKRTAEEIEAERIAEERLEAKRTYNRERQRKKRIAILEAGVLIG